MSIIQQRKYFGSYCKRDGHMMEMQSSCGQPLKMSVQANRQKKTVQNKSSRKVFVDLQKVLYQKAHKHRLNNNLSTRAKLSLHPSSNISQSKRYKRQQYANSSGYFRANTLSIIVLVQREPHHYTKMTV